MNSLNFDLDKIEDKITEKTKAIFVSPVLGNPPDMDRLVEICTRKILCCFWMIAILLVQSGMVCI